MILESHFRPPLPLRGNSLLISGKEARRTPKGKAKPSSHRLPAYVGPHKGVCFEPTKTPCRKKRGVPLGKGGQMD